MEEDRMGWREEGGWVMEDMDDGGFGGWREDVGGGWCGGGYGGGRRGDGGTTKAKLDGCEEGWRMEEKGRES